jgi:hypothetical protein
LLYESEERRQNMQETLRMVFRNQEGRLVSINLPDPNPELTALEVETVMDSIVTRNVFMTTGGNIEAKVRAEVVSRGVNVLGEFNG